jgi:hypothetical protein
VSERLWGSRALRVAGLSAIFLVGVVAALLLLRGPTSPGRTASENHVAVGSEGGRLTPSYLVVRPVGAHFGDTLTADAEIVLDHVDPSTVRIRPRFTPYSVVRSSREQHASGGRTALRLHWSLQCLRVRCLAANGRDRVFDFGLTADAPGIPLPLVEQFPPLLVTSRLALPGTGWQMGGLEQDASAAPSSVGLTLSSVLAVGLLGTAALVLLAPRLRLRGASHAPAAEERADALQEAIRRVDEVVVAVSWERQRGALDNLARVLEGADAGLAREFRALAWQEAQPDDVVVAELLERARRLRR